MKTITADYNLTEGFAWIEFEDGGEKYSLQACLMERKECSDEGQRYKMVEEGRPIYKKEINANDDGMDWGISGDTNSTALKKFGADTCAKFFYREMKNIGIRY